MVLGREPDGHQRLVLGDQGLRALLESCAVSIRPPIVELARAVIATALIVESVTDLVADHGADSAVIGRGVAGGVEERVLQDRGGEDDLVHRRVVVGVDHLRRHVPLIAIDGFADLVDVAVVLEDVRASDVAEDVRTVDLQRGVVAPHLGVADPRRERIEFGEGPFTGLRAHPLERRDALPVRLNEVRDELIHRGLRRRRVVALHVDLADGLAQSAFGDGDAALPALADRRDTRDLGAVEREVLLHDVVGEVGRGGVHDVRAQPRLPLVQPLLGEQRAETLECAWLRDDGFGEGMRSLSLSKGGRHDRVTPRCEVDADQALQFIPGLEVVGGDGVAAGDVVPVMRGDLLL